MVSTAIKLKDSCSLEENLWELGQHIKKQRHHFANKSPSSQSYGSPAVTYECDSWTVQMAEHQKIDAFELWCWRRLLRVPWTARRSNQSILMETTPEYSLEGLMLNLKLQYFGHLMGRADSLENTLMLGNIEDRRSRGQQWTRFWTASLTQWTWVWASSGRWWRTGKRSVLQSMGSQRSDMTEGLNNNNK